MSSGNAINSYNGSFILLQENIAWPIIEHFDNCSIRIPLK